MEIKEGEVVLCKFYFSDLKKSKNRTSRTFKVDDQKNFCSFKRVNHEKIWYFEPSFIQSIP